MDIQAVESQTKILIDQGHEIFQIHRFGDDVNHVKALADFARFPNGARIADFGSGTGKVSSIMKSIRRDLCFTLINISEYQLSLNDEFENIHCSFIDIPVPDGTFDAGMFCFSIGHEDHAKTLNEAFRVLKRGAVLFVYDMIRVGGDNSRMDELSYHVDHKPALDLAFIDAGFQIDDYAEPIDNGEYGKNVLGEKDFDYYFSGTKPCFYRLIKND